jgi:hypothetical protein
MQELQNYRAEQVQIAGQREVRKEKKYLGTLHPHTGHKIWQIDLSTKEIAEAEFEKEDHILTARGVNSRKRILVKPHHLYCSALNRKNALKKFVKMIYDLD